MKAFDEITRQKTFYLDDNEALLTFNKKGNKEKKSRPKFIQEKNERKLVHLTIIPFFMDSQLYHII